MKQSTEAVDEAIFREIEKKEKKELSKLKKIVNKRKLTAKVKLLNIK